MLFVSLDAFFWSLGSEMRGRCGFGRELELTVEEGTTERIAGCHCLSGGLYVHSNGIELCVLCSVFCVLCFLGSGGLYGVESGRSRLGYP